MSAKVYVNLWKRVSAKGTEYLSGKNKKTDEYFYLFNDKHNENLYNLKKKVGKDGSFQDVITLNKRTAGEGEEQSVFFSNGDYIVGSNLFFFNKDGTSEMRNKEGEAVVDSDGNPLENASHTLTIGSSQEVSQ